HVLAPTLAVARAWRGDRRGDAPAARARPGRPRPRSVPWSGRMTKLLTVAEMTLRELLRRRGVLALLLLLPLAFYLIRRPDSVGQSVRSLFLGIGWAVGTAALFATSANRAIEPRLRMAGYRSVHLYLGRMLGLWALGLVIAIPFYVLVAVDATGVRP